MLRKKLTLLALLGACSLLVACGADCVDMCEQAQEDGDCYQEIDGGDQDCEELCEDVEEIAAEDNGDCEEELDTLLDCMSSEDNACDAVQEGSCVDENNDFQDCIGDYCIDNPTHDSCGDFITIR
jgi:hypothetical protein